MGHLIAYNQSTSTTDPSGEISIFMQPPIGQTLDPSTVSITVTTYDTSTPPVASTKSMAENTPVSATGYYTNLTQATRPDKNGNITVTLTTTTVAGVAGTITGSFMVEAKASTKAGVQTTVDKTF
jgi:hypothetical protein